MEIGSKGSVEFIVDESCTAKTFGSGELDVLATPKMIAGLEEAAWKLVAPYLEEGCGTVGTLMNATHDAATPVGMKVTCTATLVKEEGRKLTFEVEAFDECGHIGGGVHERFVINNEKFQSKTDSKRK